MGRIYLGMTLALMLQTVPAQSQIEISLKTGDEREIQARDQLQRIVKSYNLSKWIFTKSVLIERGAVPHSHPVLTLNTRHLDSDLHQLSTFIHEQIHWYLIAKSRQTDQALKELREMHSSVPADPPAAAEDQDSTYLHLLLNYLEYAAMKELVGAAKAKEIFDFWVTDHYTWIYKTVVAEEDKIRAIVEKYKLQI